MRDRKNTVSRDRAKLQKRIKELEAEIEEFDAKAEVYKAKAEVHKNWVPDEADERAYYQGLAEILKKRLLNDATKYASEVRENAQ